MNEPKQRTEPERVTRFSDDRIYRYTLWREWDIDSISGTADDQPNAEKFVMFIGVNPSTADETKDDPTIRRCVGFAKAWGYGALLMTNLFAYRATDPNDMKAFGKPIGEEAVHGELNDEYLISHALYAGLVVCAWGKNGKHLFRGIRVKRMLIENGVELKCLRLLKDGQPEHPLYIPAITKPIPFILT